MADSKVADLTEITSPADGDLAYLVADPAGTPVDRKVTVANLRKSAADWSVSVYRTANQTGLASGSFTAITWQAEEYDNGGYWVVGSPTRLTVPSGGDGLYSVVGAAHVDALADQKEMVVAIYKNGAEAKRGVRASASAAHTTGGPAAAQLSLAATDYLELQVYHDHGANRDFGGGQAICHFAMARVGV